MAGLGGILGNPVLEQLLLYNVVGQLIGAALGPFLIATSNTVNTAEPLVALTPAEAAEAVLRNVMDEGAGAAEAVKYGVNAERFHVLALLAGNAPDPTGLAVALRRHIIDEGRYLTGIRQGRLRDEWAEVVKELAVQEPTPDDALEALVEGQLSEGEARAKFAAFGGMASEFDWLLGTRGAAPSPLEAADMVHRGLIPRGGKGLGVLSFDQAVAEGHTRTKWTDAYWGLAQYLPPPRTITAMHREGALSDAEAARLLEEQGVSAQLAQVYLRASSSQKVAHHRQLAESTVLALYRDRLIPRAEAVAFLEALTFTAQEADFILQVEDMRLTARATEAAVNRVHGLYTGHKIDQAAASAALASVGIDAHQAGELVAVWTHERAANVRTLTPAQVEAALEHGIIDQATAQGELEAMGYTPHDAWLALSVHHKSALPGEPPH